MKEIKLIKNRSDIGAGTRGSDLGIDAIEIAAINSKDDYFNLYKYENVETENETIYDKVNNSFAKRIGSVINVCTRLSSSVAKSLERNEYPIVLSGDHSSALGTISGIKTANPTKTLGVVWIDAHADVHSPYTSPSGNIHGMPLAAALFDDNLDCKTNEVSEETARLWSKMKNIGVDGQKIKHEHIIYFGVRDTEEPEEKVIEKNKIKNYTVEEIRYRGYEKCLKEAVQRLEDCDIIYISFDVDSLDCDLISKGTGTPVSRGFDINEAICIIQAFVKTKKTVCFEVVEVNPTLDNKGNRMAEAAFEVLKATTDTIVEKMIH
ncbi:arginase [Aquimarina muelleri]|uniref:Arginase n=1 Tax=Aquimarina muelleri TaxID=279356 RepID=A0A918JVG5_9FLAO|nr:arginase [Aquimarina muelleri]MCX2762113.1 arginase [Aquimarina muelleri]GGX17247.1 arginase [Aquimarina muelleri]